MIKLLRRTKAHVFIRTIFISIAAIILSSPLLFAAHDYANALYLATYFYGAQRCGNTSSWIHAACHTKDGSTETGAPDLTGGWHDCGDHVSFGQTGPYAAGVLITGYLLYPASYADSYSQAYSAAPGNGIPDVLDEVKIETDFLIKCITSSGRFYYQKGNGDYDHKHMCEPAYYSTNYTVSEGGESDGGRPMYYVTSGGSNVAGDAAAALALMAVAYAPYDSTYADTCFAKAKAVFAIGDTNPGTVAGGSYYSAANYQDDMAWGAICIYRASKYRGATDSAYLTKAQTYIAGAQGAGSWPLCYDHTEFLAHYELYKQTASSTDLTWMQSDMAYYKNQMTTCGIGSYAHVTSWGSLRYAANMAFAAILLNSISADSTVYAFAKNNIDFILGTHGDIAGSPNCPQGRSFLIGYTNPDYPTLGSVKHPHHRAAFGKTSTADTDWQTEDSSPGSIAYKYVLKGGLVGGPQAACGTYNDRINDYTSNEVGVDYNAGLVGALAGIIHTVNPATATVTPTINLSMTRTSTPTITRTPTITPTSLPTNKLNLQVMMSSGGTSSCAGQMSVNLKIINNDTVAIPVASVTVRVWLNTSKTITVEKYNCATYNSSGTGLGDVTTVTGTQTTLASAITCDGRTATVYIDITFATGTDIPPGGYLYFNGVIRNSDWSSPIDASCNSYSQIPATYTSYTEDSHFNLIEKSTLVCEYTDSTTQDAKSGINPVTGASACGGAAANTATSTPTPTFTRTYTATYTRTPSPSVTPSTSPTKTATITATPTYSSTGSGTYTPTFTFTNTQAASTSTSTPTATKTGTVTYTATSTPTCTATRTFTATATKTLPAASYTVTPTYTATGTNTPTPTLTFTPSCTSTLTSTPTGTPSFSPTYTYTVTLTGTPTYTGTSTPTGTATGTFTITQTYTYSPTDTPYAGTPTNTWTDSPTPTITLTETSTLTETPSWTPTITTTATPTYTGTSTLTNTPTFTNTPEDTPTNTPMNTSTNTPVDTATGTPQDTLTATLVNTATNTPVNTTTNTPVNTSTNTPVDTVTATATEIPIYTATNTPVTAALEGHLKITDCKSYPNPYIPSGLDLNIGYNITRGITSIDLYVYSNASRLVRHYTTQVNQPSAGYWTIQVKKELFEELSSGIYFYIVKVKGNNNETAASHIEKIIILR